jgi:hypothetical protein
VLDGITEGASAPCGSCDSINDTYILQWYGTTHPGIVADCFWSCTVDPARCGIIEIIAYLYLSAGHYKLVVLLADADPPQALSPHFIIDLGTDKPSCNFNSNLDPEGGYSNFDGCDFDTTATCTVTAL